jgi:hypothetical protein
LHFRVEDSGSPPCLAFCYSWKKKTKHFLAILQFPGQRSQVRVARWQQQWDEIVDGFLVEPQNQGRVETTWEPSHEWRLAEATPSLWGLQWLTRKPLGYSMEPQNRGRRLDEEVRPPRPVQLPRRGGQTVWAGLTAQGGSLTTRVAAVEKL